MIDIPQTIQSKTLAIRGELGKYMAVLCNQGCKAHVYFKNNVPYNISDDEPHEKTCMSLRIGKWWGGYFETIPMKRIRSAIESCYAATIKGDKMTVKEMNVAINLVQSEMEYVMRQMKDQDKWNAMQKAEFAEYKTRLVAEQTLRDERRNQKARNKLSPSPSSFGFEGFHSAADEIG